MKKLLIPAALILSLVLTGTGQAFALSSTENYSIANDSVYYNGDQQPCSQGSSTGGGSTGSVGSGSTIYFLGDSITVRDQSQYQSSLDKLGINSYFDAQIGRSLVTPGEMTSSPTTGLKALSQDATEIKNSSAVVIELGTNGGDTDQTIDQAIKEVRSSNSTAPIYWVNTIVIEKDRPNPSDGYYNLISQQNQAIYAEAHTDNYQVIDWFHDVDSSGNPEQLTGNETDPNSYIDSNPESGLGVHPSIPTGVNAYVSLVLKGITGNAPAAASGGGLVCCNNGSTTLTGNSNEQQAYNFFIQNGFSDNATAGIIGNMMEESTVNPEQVQSDGNSQAPAPSVGWGIVQFTPGTTAPQIAQAANITTPIYELATQLNIVLDQLNNKAGQYSYPTVKSALVSSTSVPQATLVFESQYERPGDIPGSYPARLAFAQQAIQKYGKGSGGGGSGSSQCNPNVQSSTGYVNPFKDMMQRLVPERIDQGVDYGGGGQVDALGAGQLINGSLTSSGWDYGGYDAYIVEHLTTGAAAGKNIYVAEDCVPVAGLHVGEKVTAGQPLCIINNPTGSGIETGWANSSGDLPESQMPEAGSINGGSGCIEVSIPTLIGINYNQLLVSLGAKSGIHTTPGTCGKLPSGWPTW